MQTTLNEVVDRLVFSSEPIKIYKACTLHNWPSGEQKTSSGLFLYYPVSQMTLAEIYIRSYRNKM